MLSHVAWCVRHEPHQPHPPYLGNLGRTHKYWHTKLCLSFIAACASNANTLATDKYKSNTAAIHYGYNDAGTWITTVIYAEEHYIMKY
jgi:hypothetical protein